MQATVTRRRGSLVLMAILVALLLLSLYMQLWLLPAQVGEVVTTFTAMKLLAVPGITWGVMAIACWQAVGLIALRVVVLARNHEFGPSSYGLLWAMMAFLIAFLVLVVAAFIALTVMGFLSPAVWGLLIFGGGLGLIGVAYLVLFLTTRR